MPTIRPSMPLTGESVKHCPLCGEILTAAALQSTSHGVLDHSSARSRMHAYELGVVAGSEEKVSRLWVGIFAGALCGASWNIVWRWLFA